jgi:cephalosporin hydroxylase
MSRSSMKPLNFLFNNPLRPIQILIKNPHKFLSYLSRIIKPYNPSYKRLLKMNLADWMRYHNKEIAFHQVTWMGKKTIKNVLDAWIYQEIIFEVKPEVIIEIGSLEGGSTLFLANMLDLIGNGQVISIDIDRTYWQITHPRIHLVTGDGIDKKVVDEVTHQCYGKRVILIHDGDHSREHVFQDLKVYSDLISVGGYLIVEDGAIDIFPPGDGLGQLSQGPLYGVRDFLSQDSRFIIDNKKERYLLTSNPDGYLKKIRN